MCFPGVLTFPTMYPVLLKIGPISLYSYGLMIAIGILTAVSFIRRDAKRAGMDPRVFENFVFYSIPLGILGARLAHIVMYPQFYSWSDPLGWVAVWNGGLVFQGTVPLVVLFMFWYLRRHGISFLSAADLIFPYVPLAHGFGRFGCFLYGCCYGAPTEMPWGIPFRRVPWDTSLPATGSPAYLDHLERFSDMSTQSHWSHAVHPTQLYSFAGLLCICGILILLRNRWHPFAGATLAAYFVIYGVFRFVVEFFRGDHNPVHFFSLSDQQLFSIAFSAFGVILFFLLKRVAAASPPAAQA